MVLTPSAEAPGAASLHGRSNCLCRVFREEEVVENSALCQRGKEVHVGATAQVLPAAGTPRSR